MTSKENDQIPSKEWEPEYFTTMPKGGAEYSAWYNYILIL